MYNIKIKRLQGEQDLQENKEGLRHNSNFNQQVGFQVPWIILSIDSLYLDICQIQQVIILFSK